ncbi:MAG: iron-containing alcohol dehydrogenase [Marinomonas sp.]|uniref:iron-containing alcohol dehydrogenase n=1 Tax=unclassified Marinomonas TaxID=196814 RepID=UPI0007AEEDFA|nr:MULTISPECIES: iron-containing alcohol dehydrogenase [unclassified Marinomonas]KZM45883.1 alcohol dehydrogenase [Marinomonas sp. SBI22]KZM46401.1 alcohol dehydrogenase [Marinomonas sp. SBI8L]
MTYSQYTMNWNYPTAVRAGVGRISELADACQSLGMKAPLLVTDPGLASLPMVTDAIAACVEAGLDCRLFSNIKGNPTGENVNDGVVAFREGKHDGVIAFGGGSGLDAAKAIAFMSGQTADLWSFEDVGDNWSKAIESGIAPIVAVPTTSGTGSEVGRASVITDDANHVKKIIFHPKMLPEVVILDPVLTQGLPAKITAATGMDALSHNLEAYCSPFYHPMAEGIAIEGIRLVKEYLPQAVANGDNLDARMQMLVSSSMGATAFQRGLGGMHALAHPLGALYDAHHGLLNAILMPYVLKANQDVIAEKLSRLALYIGLEGSFDAFLQWVLDLREQLGIPHTLAAIGIDEEKAELVGRMATEDPSAGGNPISFTDAQYSQLFKNAVQGVL